MLEHGELMGVGINEKFYVGDFTKLNKGFYIKVG